MKKILFPLLAALLLCGCYEPYVKDYDYSGVYIAYQYDLRSLVVGEGMCFDFGVVLGGVNSNGIDRDVEFVVDDDLVTGDLSEYGGTDAFEGLLNSPSQSYVATAIKNAGIYGVSPVPQSYYTLSDNGKMTIKAGRHTATVRFNVDSLAVISDAHFNHKPYYAFAWRITSADADRIVEGKNFGIVALRLENMFFGSWYHGGTSVVVNDSDGSEVSGTRQIYPTHMPSSASTYEVYNLTTSGAYTCSTNFRHNSAGTMTVNMDGSEVSVSGEGITDLGSDWNRSQLLQNRKVYLNYKYSNGDGTSTVVTDTLTFRNRERDGVNEWQDSNPEHYK